MSDRNIEEILLTIIQDESYDNLDIKKSAMERLASEYGYYKRNITVLVYLQDILKDYLNEV